MDYVLKYLKKKKKKKEGKYPKVFWDTFVRCAFLYDEKHNEILTVWHVRLVHGILGSTTNTCKDREPCT